MTKNSIWTVLGVIVAVIVAWIVVSLVFKLLWFVAKLAIVAVVAIGVFLLLRSLFTKSDD